MISLRKAYQHFLSSRAIRNSAIVFSGNLSAAGFRFITLTIATRLLGPTDYGLFSLALAVMLIFTELADVGLNISLVRFATPYWTTDPARGDLICKTILKYKGLTASVVCVVGLFISNPLAQRIFSIPELAGLLRAGFVGVLGNVFLDYTAANLQSRKNFTGYALLRFTDGIGKLIAVVSLALLGWLTPFFTLLAFALVPLLSVAIGSRLLPLRFLRGNGDARKCISDLLRFAKWIVASAMLLMLFQRLDVLMLGYLTNTREVGIYAAGFTLASLIYMIARSMTTVLLPTVSEVKQRDALSIYIRESFRYTIPLFLLLLPFLWSAKFLIFRLYGASYSGSVNVFRVLAFGRLLAILTAPVGIVAYAINRPQVFTVANASQLAANCLGNYFLIPKYGALGAAIVTSGTRIVASIGIVIYIVSCLRTNSSVFFTNSTKRIEE